MANLRSPSPHGAHPVSCILFFTFWIVPLTVISAAPGNDATRSHFLYLRDYFQLDSLRPPRTGSGIRVALLDTGLDDAFILHSRNTVRCYSVISNVACGDAGFEHGTRSASALGADLHLEQTVSSFHRSGAASSTWSNYSYTGVAPGVEIIMLRVFDTHLRTKTAYLLEALDMVADLHVDVVSLSIGGYAYASDRISSRVRALAAAGVIVVAAAGNDGPSFGTVMRPADQLEVIGVGAIGCMCTGVEDPGDRGRFVSSFSGRGPMIGRPPMGTGISKPDIVALGENVLVVQGTVPGGKGLRITVAQGTSIAAPVVAASVALCLEAMIAAGVPRHLRNVAAVKAILMQTASPLFSPAFDPHRWMQRNDTGKNNSSRGVPAGVPIITTYLHYMTVLQFSMLSQGAGEVQPGRALQLIEMDESSWPAFTIPYNITVGGFGRGEGVSLSSFYQWPHSDQPLYPGGSPHLVTLAIHHSSCPTPIVTVVDGLQEIIVLGIRSAGEQTVRDTLSPLHVKELLRMEVSAQPRLMAFSGTLSVRLYIPRSAESSGLWKAYKRVEVSGSIQLSFSFFSHILETNAYDTTCRFNQPYIHHVPLQIVIIPPPPRPSRVLLDGFDPPRVPLRLQGGGGGEYSGCWSNDALREVVSPSSTRLSLSYPSTSSAEFHEHCPAAGEPMHVRHALLLFYLRRELNLFVEFYPPLTEGRLALGDTLTGAHLASVGSYVLMNTKVPMSRKAQRLLTAAVLMDGLNVILLTGPMSDVDASGMPLGKQESCPCGPFAIHGRGEYASDEGKPVLLRTHEPITGEDHPLTFGCNRHTASINRWLNDVASSAGISSHSSTLRVMEKEALEGLLVVPAAPRGTHGPNDWRSVGAFTDAASIQSVPVRTEYDIVSGRRPLIRNPLFESEAVVCRLHPHWGTQVTRRRKERKGGVKLNGSVPAMRKTHRICTDGERDTLPGGLFGFLNLASSSASSRSASYDPQHSAPGRIAIFTGAGCLSAPSSHVKHRVEDLMQLLATHVPDRVLGVMIERLQKQETGQSSICLEVIKELLYATSTGDISWFNVTAVEDGMKGGYTSSRMVSGYTCSHPPIVQADAASSEYADVGQCLATGEPAWAPYLLFHIHVHVPLFLLDWDVRSQCRADHSRYANAFHMPVSSDDDGKWRFALAQPYRGLSSEQLTEEAADSTKWRVVIDGFRTALRSVWSVILFCCHLWQQ